MMVVRKLYKSWNSKAYDQVNFANSFAMHRLKIIVSIAIILCVKSLTLAQPTQNHLNGKIPVRNLGPIINSPQEDHYPFLSHDGSTLFFTSRRPVPGGESVGDKFWIAKHDNKVADTIWSNPEYLSSLNDFKACGSICFDTNKHAYIAASETGGVDIWEISILSTGKLYPHILQSPISTAAWESSPTITLDGNTIIFSSDRIDSKGKRGKKINLFISHRSSEGRWSEAVDLGSTINIGDLQGTPNISPDGLFLFFCSKSDSSGRDIFFSKSIGNSDTSWSKPIRLPEYINSNAQDMCPVITNDGKKIIFASNRAGGYGGLDIYEAELPKEIQDMIKDSYNLSKR
ncbi:MAG TPA: hypothetical protein VFO76_07455 [Candidatus Kapabacteria bacterium]|nr:hypothetical protein [Candidatus Kapabacteria bacterium]